MSAKRISPVYGPNFLCNRSSKVSAVIQGFSTTPHKVSSFGTTAHKKLHVRTASFPRFVGYNLPRLVTELPLIQGEVQSMGFRPQNKVVFVATPDQLSCLHCYRHLWSIAVSLTHLSSGGWINAIEELFRDLDVLGIELRHPCGKLFEIPFIFEIFGDDLEAGRRWMTNFRKANREGTGPKYFCRCMPKLACVEILLQTTVSKYQRGPDTPRCGFNHLPLGW